MEPIFENSEVEIDLKSLFIALLQKWKYIVFSAIFVGAVVALINQFVLIPQYSSTSELYVLSKSTSLTSLADIQMGSSLTQDYLIVVKGRTVVNEVNKKLNLQMTYKELLEKVTVTNPSDTRILYITVKDEDPERAKEIADTFAEISSAYIAEKMDQQAPSIIEYGEINEIPIAPSKTKNTVLGAFIGAILAAVVVVIMFMMDNSVHTSDDVEKYLGLHTLSVVYATAEEEEEKSKKRRGLKRWKR